MKFRRTFSSINKYLSFVKFAHSIFSMPFALFGYFLPVLKMNYPFSWITLLLVVLCVVFARNAAMGFNRIVDRMIDKKNPRTENREIPSGIITAKNAYFFVVTNTMFFVIATFFLNNLCFMLSPIALLVILGYSYTKRFTSLSHIVLGLALALAPIGAFLAVTGTFDLLPILLSILVLFWVAGFDIIYSLQDEDFDKKENLKSLPAWVGKSASLRLSELFHLITMLMVVVVGSYGSFGYYYWVGAVLFGALLLYQHLIVKPYDLKRVSLAFFTLNGIGSLIFAVFVILDMVSF
ncbi:MAG: 4-hydroxybenzoate octaprenyltransferase [Bacteroidetes bacterium]|nr:4-hydroxybenzoate octaprenyltransferase [Bacteroidota bacterium]